MTMHMLESLMAMVGPLLLGLEAVEGTWMTDPSLQFVSAGGYATSDWLQKNLEGYIKRYWQGGNAATMTITEAFLDVSTL